MPRENDSFLCAKCNIVLSAGTFLNGAIEVRIHGRHLVFCSTACKHEWLVHHGFMLVGDDGGGRQYELDFPDESGQYDLSFE